MINLLDPDVIVLAGGVSLLPHLYTRVPELWSTWAFCGGAREPVRTPLLPSVHGDASGVRGGSPRDRRIRAGAATPQSGDRVQPGNRSTAGSRTG